MPQLKLTGQTCARLFAVNGLGNEHLDIPKTIRDAIILCQSVGRRYLWIDALCIIQDDVEEMENEINHMNDVYANADFTIVACGGEDSWAELPGVSERVVRQKIGKITGRPVATSLPSFEESMGGSTWSSRAWTLQEEFFSRRLLYFTPIQVLFHCREAEWREDRCLEASLDRDVRSENPDKLHAHDFNFPSWCWAAWLGQRENKSKRLRYVHFHYVDSAIERTYSVTQWYRLQDLGEYVRLKGLTESKEGQVLSNMLALWSTKPPSLLSRFISLFSAEIPLDRTSLPLIPASLQLDPAPQGLSKHEKSKLLVFRGYCARLKHEVPASTFLREGSHPNATKRMSRTVQLEFVLIAVRWNTYDPAAEDLPQLILLGIGTNDRGISRRNYNPIDDISMRDWVASKPVARTIFLM